jgi:integrase
LTGTELHRIKKAMQDPVSISKTPTHPSCSHRVFYPAENGTRKSRYFTNESDARNFANKRKEELGLNGSAFGTITDGERNALSCWRKFASENPAPDLLVAVHSFIADWKEKNSSVTIREALEKFVASQEGEGASPRHLSTIRSRIKRLVNDHGDTLVAGLDAGAFSDWLDGLRAIRQDRIGDKLTLTTRDNLKKTCRTFFDYCISRNWLLTNPVPAPRKKRTRGHRIALRKAPAIMLPSNVERFLHKIEEVAPLILPFWLLKFFAGIRDAEAGQVDWSMINLEKRTIELPAEITKTGDPRKVTIQPMLADWLAPYEQESGPIIASKSSAVRYYKKVLQHLRRPAKIDGKQKRGVPLNTFIFPSNAARHSFGTFHLFQFRDAGETALQLGHKSNPAMLWEHYANSSAEEHAEAFWAIRSSKLINFTEGRASA